MKKQWRNGVLFLSHYLAISDQGSIYQVLLNSCSSVIFSAASCYCVQKVFHGFPPLSLLCNGFWFHRRLLDVMFMCSLSPNI